MPYGIALLIRANGTLIPPFSTSFPRDRNLNVIGLIRLGLMGKRRRRTAVLTAVPAQVLRLERMLIGWYGAIRTDLDDRDGLELGWGCAWSTNANWPGARTEHLAHL